MSLKARLAKIDARLTVDTGKRAVCLYYGSGRTRIHRHPGEAPGKPGGLSLFLGPEIRNELFKPGTALYGLIRDKPYPPNKPQDNPWGKPRKWPILTASQVNEVLDVILESLPSRLRHIVQAAHWVVVYGPHKRDELRVVAEEPAS